jgi:hypothetical protein
MLGNRTVSLGFSIHWPATQHVPFGWSSLPPFLSTPKAFLRGTVLEHNIRQNCYRVLSLTLLLLCKDSRSVSWGRLNVCRYSACVHFDVVDYLIPLPFVLFLHGLVSPRFSRLYRLWALRCPAPLISTLFHTLFHLFIVFLPAFHPILIGNLINITRHPTPIRAIHPRLRHILHHLLYSHCLLLRGPLPQSSVAICLGRYSSNCLSCAGTELPKRLSVCGPSSKKLSVCGPLDKKKFVCGWYVTHEVVFPWALSPPFLWAQSPLLSLVGFSPLLSRGFQSPFVSHGVSVPLRLCGVSVPLRFHGFHYPVGFQSPFVFHGFHSLMGFQSPLRLVSSLSLWAVAPLSLFTPLHTRHFCLVHSCIQPRFTSPPPRHAPHLPTPFEPHPSSLPLRFSSPRLTSPPPPPPPSTMGHALPATAIRVPPPPFHLPCLSTGIYQHCTVLPTVCAEGEFLIS